MADAQERREQEKAWFAIWLAWVASFVDAVGYLILLRLALSHMSGNTIHLGLEISRADWSTALAWLLPVPLFVIGILLGALIQEAARQMGLRSTLTVLFALEAALLLAFILYANAVLGGRHGAHLSGSEFFLLAALASVAMGMQTATVHKVGGQPVRTTYITGMLSDFGEAIAAVVISAVALLAHRPALARSQENQFGGTQGDQQQSGAANDEHDGNDEHGEQDRPDAPPALDRAALRRVLLLGALWLAYALGAASGAYVEVRWSAAALFFPFGSLLCLIALDLIWPAEAPEHHQPGQRPS